MIFNKKNTKKKNAIIVGCGRFGSRIAGDLSLEEWDVTVIDNDRNAFRLLPSFLVDPLSFLMLQTWKSLKKQE